MAHAILLNSIFSNLKDDIGIEDRTKLSKDFSDNWRIKKGFIDPDLDNFENFPNIHEALVNIMNKKGHKNIIEEELKSIKNDPETVLPNWFRSG